MATSHEWMIRAGESVRETEKRKQQRNGHLNDLLSIDILRSCFKGKKCYHIESCSLVLFHSGNEFQMILTAENQHNVYVQRNWYKAKKKKIVNSPTHFE